MKSFPSDSVFTPRLARFRELVGKPESAWNLAELGLRLGFLEYAELDLAAYVSRLDELAAQARPFLAAHSSTRRKAEALAEFLFVEQGFSGNETDYHDPRNSFLSDVLDRRTGIPISLSLVFLETARRLGLNCDGVGMPGHFLVRHVSSEGVLLLDPFHGGRRLEREECRELLERLYGREVQLKPEFFAPVTQRQFLTRMLANLKNVYVKDGVWTQALRVVEMSAAVNPDSPDELRDRGLIHFRLENWSSAVADLTKYSQTDPDAETLVLIKARIAEARRELARWN